MIKTNPSGEGMAAFFCIEKERANELVVHFESVAEKHVNKLHNDIEASYKNNNSEGTFLDYNVIVQDCLDVAITHNEAAYAAWCAAGIKFELDRYGEQVNRELGIIYALRELHTNA